MSKVFLIDVAKCNGCYCCQLACKDEHCGNDWTPYAKPQPEIGHFWMKVTEHTCGTIPKVKTHYIPSVCNHCENASCIRACEAKAIYRRVEGFVIIDPEKCTGCGECAAACPYDSIYENEELGIYQKCTGCVHLLDNGYEQPRCVEACPRDALMIEDEETSGDFIFGASVPKPETGNFPRTYYRNIPGRFIAGTIYDPVEKEVVIGAACRATIGGKTYHATTDDYGDFWFNDLPIGKFNVVILAQGFEPKVFDEVSTRESVNLGDIPLERPNP